MHLRTRSVRNNLFCELGGFLRQASRMARFSELPGPENACSARSGVRQNMLSPRGKVLRWSPTSAVSRISAEPEESSHFVGSEWRALSHSNPRQEEASTDGSNPPIFKFSPKLIRHRRGLNQAKQRINAFLPVLSNSENREAVRSMKTCPVSGSFSSCNRVVFSGLDVWRRVGDSNPR